MRQPVNTNLPKRQQATKITPRRETKQGKKKSKELTRNNKKIAYLIKSQRRQRIKKTKKETKQRNKHRRLKTLKPTIERERKPQNNITRRNKQ